MTGIPDKMKDLSWMDKMDEDEVRCMLEENIDTINKALAHLHKLQGNIDGIIYLLEDDVEEKEKCLK